MPLLTRLELETILEKKYLDKIVRINYPGKDEVDGKCHNVTVETTGLCILHIGNLKYEVSIECLLEVVSILF